VSAAAELARWWLALTAGYLLLVAPPTRLEFLVGVVIGGAAAILAVTARRAFEPPLSVPAFVRRSVLLPLDVAADAVGMTWLLVTGRAFRADCGTQDEIEIEDDDAAVRAWAVLLTSAAPGSLAADVEERRGRLVLRRHLVTHNDRATAGLAAR
jgi:multisubunit Na+/H+ antiporter MnhE subunit